jgi:hypothetical protein
MSLGNRAQAECSALHAGGAASPGRGPGRAQRGRPRGANARGVLEEARLLARLQLPQLQRGADGGQRSGLSLAQALAAALRGAGTGCPRAGERLQRATGRRRLRSCIASGATAAHRLHKVG